MGAELVRTDRGGDVTYHGPGQLVGYPIVSLPAKRGGDKYGMADTVAYVRSVEQLLIDALADLGLPNVGRLREYPGVWVDPDGANPRKIAAIGVRLTRGRSMHGFALNVAPDMRYWGYIVPCGITDKRVTSLADEGIDVEMRDVVDAVAARAARALGQGRRLRSPGRRLAPLAPRPVGLQPGGGPGRDGARPAPGPADAGGRHRGPPDRRPASPPWLRSTFRTAPGYLRLKHTMRDLGLVTVCEEAGCPNIFECWADGTATFMINGERCTRACGFCLVDTRHPEPLDATEPERVAEAVERMGLGFAVVTAVARDDLDDGGAGAFAETIRAIRRRTPGVQVEVLVPDCKGDEASLATIVEARPDVFNHNVETVPRLQRAVRPSAGYARSLAVLARAKEAGLVTKSGLIVGMGETDDEVVATLADLRARRRRHRDHRPVPAADHPPPARGPLGRAGRRSTATARSGEALGIAHVESSPLTRSSYHARQAAGAAETATICG